MKDSIKKGLSFGLTSAIIATLSIIVGIHSATDLKHAIIGAVLVLAIADSLADGLSMHFSELTNKEISKKELWMSTIYTFFGKFLFAISFVIPFLIFSTHTAIYISIIYGIILLGIFSFYTAKGKDQNATKIILWHITLAITVIAVSHLIGLWINQIFG